MPMPDYKKRTAETLQKSSEKIQDQLQALNAVMRARRLNKCHSNDCIGCGNIDCIEAEKEHQELWPEKVEDWNKPERASVASARFYNTPELASERRGGNVGGLNLFNFDQQEKAA